MGSGTHFPIAILQSVLKTLTKHNVFLHFSKYQHTVFRVTYCIPSALWDPLRKSLRNAMRSRIHFVIGQQSSLANKPKKDSLPSISAADPRICGNLRRFAEMRMPAFERGVPTPPWPVEKPTEKRNPHPVGASARSWGLWGLGMRFTQ